STASGFDRRVNVGARSLRYRCQFFSRGGIGGVKVNLRSGPLPSAVDEVSESSAASIEPRQSFTRILWRGPVIHGHEFFNDAHSPFHTLLALSSALLLKQSDGDSPPNIVLSPGVPIGARYRRACRSRQIGRVLR